MNQAFNNKEEAIKGLENRKPETKANDHNGDIIDPYIRHLAWESEYYFKHKIPLFIWYRRYSGFGHI